MARQPEPFPRAAPPPREGRRAREVAGGATAEVAAVFCCVPCAVVEVVVLAAYKVPKGLMKRAVEKGKRRRVISKAKKANMSDALLSQQQQQQGKTGVVAENKAAATLEEHLANDSPERTDVDKLEEEMWAQFNETGFWRSTSQRFEQHQKQP